MTAWWLLQTAMAEAAGGAAAGAIADTILYAVDSAKVRRQTTPTVPKAAAVVATAGHGAASRGSWKILFRGLVPTVALGSVPIFGSFFLIYAPVRERLHHSSQEHWLPLAAALCAVPATIIGVPSDVIKKHLVLGKYPSFDVAVRNVLAQHGWKGLWAGWHVNLIRDLLFAGVKVGLYELLVGLYQNQQGLKPNDKISTTGAAFCGVTSGVGCAILTAPLDVINTRIKAGETGTSLSKTSTSICNVGRHILVHEGLLALFRGVGMRSVVLGVGSSIFWPIQRGCSHILQPDFDANFHDRLEEF